MLKEDITYKNFEGVEVTETWYFNLSISEIARMELMANGSLLERLQQIAKSNDGALIIPAFEDIIGKSVGKKSEDGKRFLKSPAITQEFMGSEAYNEFFMKLITDAGFAARFVSSLVPSDLAEKAAELRTSAQGSGVSIAEQRFDEAIFPTNGALTVDDFTHEELVAMPEDYLQSLYAGKLFSKPRLVDKQLEDYTTAELFDMPQELFDRLVGTNPKLMARRHLIIAMQRRAAGK